MQLGYALTWTSSLNTEVPSGYESNTSRIRAVSVTFWPKSAHAMASRPNDSVSSSNHACSGGPGLRCA